MRDANVTLVALRFWVNNRGRAGLIPLNSEEEKLIQTLMFLKFWVNNEGRAGLIPFNSGEEKWI